MTDETFCVIFITTNLIVPTKMENVHFTTIDVQLQEYEPINFRILHPPPSPTKKTSPYPM